MRMLDLFSGIGGFSLAASWVWGDELEIVAFCEIDKFCQRVLKKHWPDVPIIEDIREVTGERITAYTKFGESIDLLTGGFPCQPFSCAGKRKGRSDDRFLWPEMLRVIREVHPTWVIAENVGGLFTQESGLVFEQVLSDLEAEGYDIQPLCIPACAKGAPHRRDRWWIVAHSLDNTDRTDRGQIRETDSIQGERGKALGGRVFTGTDCHVTDTECERLLRLGQKGSIVREWELEQDIKERCEVGSNDARCNTGWSENWLEVATSLCRVDDGVSNRVDRLKSLGNAIVPQVAYEIMKAIRQAGILEGG
jgi:DNA (cytosine-5)-methyltransferase 1